MEPATTLYRDVFTCKGLTEDRRWVGVTDVFLPEKDPRVVVVAQLAPEDALTTITYELTNPYRSVVLTERRVNPRENPLGIYFELDDLMKLGGEGEWKATVYADGLPIGQSVFYIGEKPEVEEEKAGPRFLIIGEESLSEESASRETSPGEADRFGTYIREVTPELSIPASAATNASPSPRSASP